MGGRISALPWRKTTAAVAVVSLLIIGITLLRESDDRTATAYFENSTGVYAGDEVRVLGVPVGTIDKIEPTAQGAKVTFTYDEDVKIPADAQAAIIAPSLVSSRYVQLAPQYESGEVMADGAVIPAERTAVPVEFDEIKGELDDLSTALGPQGVNKEGALSEFVTTTRKALDGQGQSINDTIAQLSSAVEVLNTGREDVFSTVDNLQVFVSALATSDQQIREFSQRLDVVSGILDSNRQSLRTGLRNLSTAVKDVRSFVVKNRKRIVTTTTGLADVLAIVASQRNAIEQTLHTGPNALANLFAAYHKKENSIAAGLQSANTHNLQQLVCGAVGAVGPRASGVTQACATFLGPLLNGLSQELPLSSAILAQLEAVLGW